MSGLWISAGKARTMVSEGDHDSDMAVRAILKSASVGLIETKAEKFIYENDVEAREQLNCRLPSFFWPRDNFAAFEQDWARSIFSTTAGLIRCHAFGVTFCVAHIEGIMRGDEKSSAPKREAISHNPPQGESKIASGTPLLVSQEQAREMLGIGRTKLSELLAEGTLKSRKLGRRRLVLLSSVQRLAGGTLP